MALAHLFSEITLSLICCFMDSLDILPNNNTNLLLALRLTPLWLLILLTNNRNDHDQTIKQIPAIGEVVLPQSKDFDETLNCEDDHKGQVETLKDGTHGFRLAM